MSELDAFLLSIPVPDPRDFQISFEPFRALSSLGIFPKVEAKRQIRNPLPNSVPFLFSLAGKTSYPPRFRKSPITQGIAQGKLSQSCKRDGNAAQ